MYYRLQKAKDVQQERADCSRYVSCAEVGNVERLNDHSFERMNNERVAVISIRPNRASGGRYLEVAERIARAVREQDRVLWSEERCLVVLPETSYWQAEERARRLCMLFIHLDYDIQIVSGSAAQLLLQQVYQQTIVYQLPAYREQQMEAREERGGDPRPYLAFLEHYPPLRVFHVFPFEFACRYHCAPLGIERNVMTLATETMLEQEAQEHIQRLIQKRIFQVRCDPALIHDVLQYWQQSLYLQASAPPLQLESCLDALG